MSILRLAWLLLAPTLAWAQPATSPRLIVRSDDLGMALAVNQAAVKCHQEGIATSVEVIVPAPWFPDAAKRLNAIPSLDVGFHLTLSSEWDNVKWRPVSDAPSLRDASGYFFPMIHRNTNYPGRALVEQPWKLADVE
jgi:hypothetical protein